MENATNAEITILFTCKHTYYSQWLHIAMEYACGKLSYV